MTPAQAISRLYHLKVDTTTRDGDGSPHEKPHKPLLLLAALDLIDEGLATPERIPWCQNLRDRFSARFEIVKKLNDRNNPGLPSISSTPPTFSPGTASVTTIPPTASPSAKTITGPWTATLSPPPPDHRWQVSPVVDARRSNGEQALSELTGKTLLLPKDPAFHPDKEGLEWRVRNLVA